MSTVAEIESAIESLPPEKLEAVLQWLQARQQKAAVGAESTARPGGFALFGALAGKITYRDGWDEPLEDFRPYME